MVTGLRATTDSRVVTLSRVGIVLVVAMLLSPSGASALGSISGVVRDDTATPISKPLCVELLLDDGTPSGSSSSTTLSGAGSFSFTNLPDVETGVDPTSGPYGNRYYLTVDECSTQTALPAYAHQIYDADAAAAGWDPIVLTSGADVVANMTSSRLARVTGTVSRSPGGPAADFCVAIPDVQSYPSYAYGGTVATAPDGTFSRLVVPGTTIVEFYSCGGPLAQSEWYDNATTFAGAAQVTIAPGQTRTLDATLAGAGQVSGTVSAVPGPDPDLYPCVQVYDAAGNLVRAMSSIDLLMAAGAWSFDTLPPGAYRVGVRDCAPRPVTAQTTWARELFNGGASSLDAAAPLTVALDQNTVVPNIALTGGAGGAIKGTVVLPLNEPADYQVTVFDAQGRRVADREDHNDIMGGPFTPYYVGGLNPGSYRVLFEPPSGGNLKPEFYDDVAALADATPVVIAPGGGITPGINATLDGAGPKGPKPNPQAPVGGTTSGPGPAGQAPAQASRQAPAGFSILGTPTLRRLLGKGIRLTYPCAGPCRVTARLELKGKAVAKASTTRTRPGTASLVLRARGKQARALRKLPRAAATIKLVVEPEQGNAMTLRRFVTLRR